MIKIDVSQMLKDVKIMTDDRRAAITTVMSGVCTSAQDMILTRAKEALSNKSFAAYNAGMLPMQELPGTITIELDTPGANALEQGYEGFDMKPGLLRGEPSRNVRMEFSPEAEKPGVQSKGPQQLSPQAAKSLGAAVKAAKAKLAGQGGGTATARGKAFASPKPNWKFSKDSNATQKIKMTSSGETSHGQVFVFRHIDQDSPGWQHPGYAGVKAFEGVSKEIIPMLEKALIEAFK